MISSRRWPCANLEDCVSRQVYQRTEYYIAHTHIIYKSLKIQLIRQLPKEWDTIQNEIASPWGSQVMSSTEYAPEISKTNFFVPQPPERGVHSTKSVLYPSQAGLNNKSTHYHTPLHKRSSCPQFFLLWSWESSISKEFQVMNLLTIQKEWQGSGRNSIFNCTL